MIYLNYTNYNGPLQKPIVRVNPSVKIQGKLCATFSKFRTFSNSLELEATIANKISKLESSWIRYKLPNW